METQEINKKEMSLIIRGLVAKACNFSIECPAKVEVEALISKMEKLSNGSRDGFLIEVLE